MAEGKMLGITVMPEWIQVEGAEAVLDNLALAGATAVGTSPYVMAPVAEGQGGREPPIDAGAGKVRLLDRDLWGRREIWCRTAPSFEPDRALYAGLRYQPAAPDELTRSEGPKLALFIRAAKARGLAVHLQVQAAIPPGYRVQFGGPEEDDAPRLPDGSLLPERVDKNGSLASLHIRDYGVALLRDLAGTYPEIDAIRVDWPEYPPYTLDSWFTDFSSHAHARALSLGYDVERMALHASEVRAMLLTAPDPRLLEAAAAGDAEALFETCSERWPGLLDLVQLKHILVLELLEAYRAALPPQIALIAHAFPPPWSVISGLGYRGVGEVVQGIGCKLYTMHWPMMLRQYGEAMRTSATGAEVAALARLLVRAFDTGGPEPRSLAELRYPEPDELHPAGDAAMARKIRLAAADAAPCPVHAMAHSYGPIGDVERRFRVAWEASDAGVWVNRYGYCSDAKLAAFGRIARAG